MGEITPIMVSLHSSSALSAHLPNEASTGAARIIPFTSSASITSERYALHDPYDWICLATDYLNPYRVPFHHATVQQMHTLSHHLPPPPSILTRQWLQMVWRQTGEPGLLYLIRCLAFHYGITMLAPTVRLGTGDHQCLACATEDATSYSLCWGPWPPSPLFSSPSSSSLPHPLPSGPGLNLAGIHPRPVSSLPPPFCTRDRSSDVVPVVRCGLFRVVGLHLPATAVGYTTGCGRRSGEGYGGGGTSVCFSTEYVQTGWETSLCLSCLFFRGGSEHRRRQILRVSTPSDAARLPVHLGGTQCEFCGEFLPLYPAWNVRAHVVLMEEVGEIGKLCRDGVDQESISSSLRARRGDGKEAVDHRHRPSCSAVVLGESNIAALRLGCMARCIYFERAPSPSVGRGEETASGAPCAGCRMLAIHSAEAMDGHLISRSSLPSSVPTRSTVRQGHETPLPSSRTSSTPCSSTFHIPLSLSSSSPLPPLSLDMACALFAPEVLGNRLAKQALLLCALHAMYTRHPRGPVLSFPCSTTDEEDPWMEHRSSSPSSTASLGVSQCGGRVARLYASCITSPLHAVLLGAGKSGKSSLLQAVSRLWERDGCSDAAYLSPTVVRGGLEALWPHRSGDVWCGGAALMSPAVQLEEGVLRCASKLSRTLLHLRGLLEHGEIPENFSFCSSLSFPFRGTSLFLRLRGRGCSCVGAMGGDRWWSGESLLSAREEEEVPPFPFFSKTQLTMGMEEEALTMPLSNASSFSGLLGSFRLFIPLQSGLSLSHSVMVSDRVRSEASVRRRSGETSLYATSPGMTVGASSLDNCSRRCGRSGPPLSPLVPPPEVGLSHTPCSLPRSFSPFSSPCDMGAEAWEGESPSVALPWELSPVPRRRLSHASHRLPGGPHSLLFHSNGSPLSAFPLQTLNEGRKEEMAAWLRSLREDFPRGTNTAWNQRSQEGDSRCSRRELQRLPLYPPDYKTIEHALDVAGALPFFYERLTQHFWLVQQAALASTPGTMPATTLHGAVGMPGSGGRSTRGLALPPPACLRGNLVQGTVPMPRPADPTQHRIPACQCVPLQSHLETLHSLSVSRLLLPDALHLATGGSWDGEEGANPPPADIVFTMAMAEEVWTIYEVSLRTAARRTTAEPPSTLGEGGRRAERDLASCVTALPPSSLFPAGIIGSKRTRAGRPAKKALCLQFIQGLSQLQETWENGTKGGEKGRGNTPHHHGVCRMDVVKRLYAQMGGLEVFHDTLDGFVSQLQEMGMMIKRPGGWMVRGV